ncbi:MAG TPA: GTPase domain-containing protein [Fimbriiglobus sp.]|nr:GTPase domain-containing protein [Fimbriiglobus sp.]
MPPPPTTADAVNGTDPSAPRVVFFGPSNSGKSALINRFVRAASAPDATAVELTPAAPPNGIRRELVPQLIRVDNPAAGPTGGRLVVVDCDGRAAGELLSHPSGLVRGKARGALAEAVRSADALVLVVDAAASPEQVDQTFRNFGSFLDGLEEGRTFGREVGGLPVFLTLAKCDALHRAGDSPTDWLARVAERERELRDRFEDYFGDETANEEPSPFLPFGSIDLHQAATSIQVPDGKAFAAYADPDGAFGVARLVRETLPAARGYRARVLGARKRLKWTLTGAGALLGAMLVGLLVLLASGGLGRGDLLTERVRAYRAGEPPPAVYLSDRNFAHNRRELLSFRESIGFGRLSDELRAFVEDRLREFDAYKEYRDKFKPPRLGPAEIQTPEQAAKLDADLQGELAPPDAYANRWAETEAGRLWQKWRTDLRLVREAEAALHDWYSRLIQRGNTLLLTESPPDFGWRAQVGALFRDAKEPPFRPEQEVEKSPSVPVLRGKPLTYAPAFESARMEQARQDWQATREKLRHLRDLTDSIGLTTGPGSREAVLDLPEPLPTLSGSKELAAVRLAGLRSAYPPPAYPSDEYPEWAVAHFPDPVRKAVTLRLQSIFDTGVRHVRRLIGQAAPSPETAEGWRKVADALLQDPELKAWGRLLGLYRRWIDPTAAADPVAELVEFLRHDRYELNMKSIQVAIPDDLLGVRATPAGRLVVTHTPAGGQPVEYPYRQEGEGKRDRPVTTYTFVSDGHPGTILYRPGDELTATLPLKAGGEEYRLVWQSGRSTVYQIDRLAQPPRLERVGPVPAPVPAPGVRLTVSPPGGLPAVPVLFPDLRVGPM